MFLIVLLCGLLVSSSTAEFCYDEVEAACSPKPVSSLLDGPNLPNCNAKYGAIDSLQTDLQAYANGQLESSFEYLLMSTHFGNYETNRAGFQKLYRKLSDLAWQKSIDLIKYISTRGGKMNFNQLPHLKKNSKESHNLEVSELHSLAKALDSQKQLANEVLRLHNLAKNHQDAAIAHYLEEEFLEKQTEEIRNLAGHTADLKNLLNRDAPLAVFLFDEYLQKAL
ncbi:ferritin heavy chain A [Trichogramma pretiosum]|uniref:Ferritin n=1 Tax=Trichogramma kaykai TaxID=54128 RepID=A0ABD2XJW3_9HYME|nr:ferritin heavy chain A [Trichogramma pretiosum]